MASSTSMSTSKRRKLEATWSDIINTLTIDGDLKSTLPGEFIKSGSTADYLKQPEFVKQSICEKAGIEGWHDNIAEAIIKSQEGIPSPSNMKWDDVEHVLSGNISCSPNGLNDNLPDITKEEETHLKSQYTVANSVLTQISEADASCRVITLLLALFRFLSHGKIKCQPTISHHQTFTDYFIKITNGTKCVIIKVKRFDIVCSLRQTSDQVAQVLREAHILLMEQKHLSSLLFVLTNSVQWSFGVAERSGEKISVISSVHYALDHVDADVLTVYKVLKKYLISGQ